MIAKDSEFLFLDPVQQGATLTEKAVDVHVVDGEDIVARWFHSPLESDLMIWFDASGAVVRFQLNAGGQILDWTSHEGLQTGLIVELEVVSQQDVAETIRFDLDVNSGTVQTARLVFANCLSLKPDVRAFALTCLNSVSEKNRVPRINASRTRFWGRFKRWTTGA